MNFFAQTFAFLSLQGTYYLFICIVNESLYLFLLIFYFMFIMHVIPVSIYTDGGGINDFN